jgi:hypothetical protein
MVVQIKARTSDIKEYFNKCFHFLFRRVRKVKRHAAGIANIPIAIIIKIKVFIDGLLLK